MSRRSGGGPGTAQNRCFGRERLLNPPFRIINVFPFLKWHVLGCNQNRLEKNQNSRCAVPATMHPLVFKCTSRVYGSNLTASQDPITSIIQLLPELSHFWIAILSPKEKTVQQPHAKGNEPLYRRWMLAEFIPFKDYTLAQCCRLECPILNSDALEVVPELRNCSE